MEAALSHVARLSRARQPLVRGGAAASRELRLWPLGARRLAQLLPSLLVLSACSAERAPPPGSLPEQQDAGWFDAKPPPPPPLDADGLCGNALIPIVDERPNLYFVVDHSGSMNQRVAGKTLVSATHEAIFELLSQVGHHVHYGAAVFPNPNAGDCSAGLEVFRTTLGDPPYSGGRPGLSLSRLMSSLESAPVRGGTPISPTLDLLTPTLTALPGRTYVILATDGGPNCNSEATCDGDGCQLNLEGASFGSQRCDHRLNCCDPALFQGAQLNCLDDAKTLASIATLRARGIDTFVIGMPGSELYESTLARLAVAGGRPLPRAPRYYSAGTPEALRDALLDIGLAVAISCRITLDEPPKDPALVNLYFDNQLVPSDPDDGWVWRGDDEIELTGARCQRLQSGKVTNVQIVSGCPTEVK